MVCNQTSCLPVSSQVYSTAVYTTITACLCHCHYTQSHLITLCHDNGTTCPVQCTHTKVQNTYMQSTCTPWLGCVSQHIFPAWRMDGSYIHTYTIASYTCVHHKCLTYLLVGDRRVSSAFIDAGNSTRGTMTQALSFIFPADDSATA